MCIAMLTHGLSHKNSKQALNLVIGEQGVALEVLGFGFRVEVLWLGVWYGELHREERLQLEAEVRKGPSSYVLKSFPAGWLLDRTRCRQNGQETVKRNDHAQPTPSPSPRPPCFPIPVTLGPLRPLGLKTTTLKPYASPKSLGPHSTHEAANFQKQTTDMHQNMIFRRSIAKDPSHV